ncbi:ROK family transcriptional regulator [Paenibacillus sp. BC26]|uniref:ROK family transcriptional regulator n=1 Tax=Paenibacillus sp. BC26 TaxID=1881032 RepID=UPI0008ED1282|nr:ROK family transcriptional regulator [Paenibacillus sp. BC26]SFS74324.1 glucokinase/N-acetylglucosamine repressor [Paenibacillus sp. BC26]
MARANVGKDQKGTKTSIIQTLRINGSVARIDLAKLTNLSRATISISIAELIESGLVQETESKYSTGGRPATILELTPNSKIIVGADFSNNLWTLGAFDLLGNVVHKAIIPVNGNSPIITIQTLIDHLSDFLKQINANPIELLGLGLPGLVDINRGVIKGAYDLGWYNIEIVKMIQEQFNWPTIVLNRHRARGLAECRFGAGKEFSHLVYIGVGTGISAGIFNNRELLFGAIGGAGDLGHVTIDPNGPLCPCGNHGCLQQLATGPVMEQEIRMLLRSGRTSSIYTSSNFDLQHITSDMICQGADAGDELCMEVVEKAATNLGIAMANLINLLNPEAIILGGPIPINCDFYVKIATKVMHQRSMNPLSANVVVRKGQINEMGGALGAANFALDQNLEYSLFNS